MKHSNFDKTLTLFLTFLKIGAFTFGGGYAMVALLESEFIYKKKWIEKDDFLNMIAIAESTPGPMAVTLATILQDLVEPLLQPLQCAFLLLLLFILFRYFSTNF